ncbi:MAG: PIN domain-containing protein [Solirubrobacterales bacterium]
MLDTNVVIRHFTGEPTAMARKATAILNGPHRLVLTDVVFSECIFVLESFYEVERDDIAALMRSLLGLGSISTDNERLLVRALEHYEIERLDFAEAHLVARAELAGIAKVASFDRSIDQVDGIRRITAAAAG